MVRTDEREKQGEGRMATMTAGCGSLGAYEDLYDSKSEASRIRDKIDRAEKEIVRLTMIAEKDKRESIACTNRTKKLKEQLRALADSPSSPSPDEIRRSYSESDLAEQQLSCGYSVTPPSSLPTFRVPQIASSSLGALGTENKSPNISPNVCEEGGFASKIRQELATLENSLVVKEDELFRVKLRAKEEAARAVAARNEEDEVKKALANETELRRRTNQDMKAAIARKEKEIQRLSMLAERDKRAGMVMRDQIAHQKKTLTAFANACPDKRNILLHAISSCDDIIIPSPSSSTVSSLSSTPISPLSLTPTSPSQFSLLSSKSGFAFSATSSPLRQEMDSLLRADACKEEELCRVSAIADTEAYRATVLKEKAVEIKQVIAAELQQANETLERKLKQIRNQQSAIHKVAAHADLEHAKALKLQEELTHLAKLLCEQKCNGRVPVEMKKSEYTPDKAYLSEFKELRDLVPEVETTTTTETTTDGSADTDANAAAPTPTPAAATNSNSKGNATADTHHHHNSHSSPTCGCVDPIIYIQSPPCKQISFCESEAAYVQKLRDINVLDREVARIDEELMRVKRLKEAEIVRRKLLQEKLRELKEDVDYLRLMKNSQTRESSRTF